LICRELRGWLAEQVVVILPTDVWSVSHAADATDLSADALVRSASLAAMNWFTAICTPISNAETLVQVGAEVGANVHRLQTTSGDVQRSSPQVERHAGRHHATPSYWVELIWEQEAAGSNPAIPTAIFRMYCLSWMSHPGRRP
jgi:hypothetical protein